MEVTVEGRGWWVDGEDGGEREGVTVECGEGGGQHGSCGGVAEGY